MTLSYKLKKDKPTAAATLLPKRYTGDAQDCVYVYIRLTQGMLRYNSNILYNTIWTYFSIHFIHIDQYYCNNCIEIT